MLNLASTSDKLRLTASIAGSIQTHVTWIDQSGSGLTLLVTPGRVNNAAITGVAITDIVAAPGAGVQRNIKVIHVYNGGSVYPIITLTHTDGANPETLWKGILSPGEFVIYADGMWTLYSAIGVPKAGNAPTDAQSFAAAGVYYWIKPAGSTIVKVRMWGAGGGGGHGNATATTAALQGGSGGGGGAYSERFFLAADVPNAVRATVGKGGLAKPAGVAGNGSGATPGGSSSFGFGSELGAFPAATVSVGNILFAGGGGGGFTGNASGSGGGGGGGTWGRGETKNTTSGAVASGGVPGQNIPVAGGGPPGSIGPGGAGTGTSPGTTLGGEWGGGGGGGDNAGTGPGTSPGGSSLFGAGGGACGSAAGFAGIAVPHLGFPQQGGTSGRSASGGGGAAGSNGSGVNATNGGDGPAGDSNRGGGGGGSGGGCDSTVNGVAGNGGNGGWPGGGGGGGGSCTGRSVGGTQTAGIGGNGADGAVYVESW